jgi:hypothetical protein
MQHHTGITRRILCQRAGIGVDSILRNVVGHTVVGGLDVLKLVVRTGIVARQGAAIAEVDLLLGIDGSQLIGSGVAVLVFFRAGHLITIASYWELRIVEGCGVVVFDEAEHLRMIVGVLRLYEVSASATNDITIKRSERAE